MGKDQSEEEHINPISEIDTLEGLEQFFIKNNTKNNLLEIDPQNTLDFNIQPYSNVYNFQNGYTDEAESNIESLLFDTNGQRKANLSNIDPPHDFKNNENINFSQTVSNTDFITKQKFKKCKRKHSKSRNGCDNCKKRRIKCDEKLPQCSYCEKKGIQCSYLTLTPFQIYRLKETKQRNRKLELSTEFNTEEDHKESFFENLPLNHNISPQATTMTTKMSNVITDSSSITSTNSSYTNIGFSFSYTPNREVNLNTNSTPSNNAVYRAHGMEGVLLPPSMCNNIAQPENSSKTYKYVPLSTGDDISSLIPQKITNSPLPNNIAINDGSLYSNTKISRRTFFIDHSPIIKKLEYWEIKAQRVLSALHRVDFNEIEQIKREENELLDAILIIDFFQTLSVATLFDTLLRKSVFLFAMDYYKNVLLQQNILPDVIYKSKISISCTCENESVRFIEEITKMIQLQYLPLFNQFSLGSVNILTGALTILDCCLLFHFKNGLKYELSIDEANKAIKLSGIFSTGLYTICMEKSREELLLSGTNILSAHLITNFKRLLAKSYSFEIFHEFRKGLEKLSSRFGNDVNFENLKLFCDQNIELLHLNKTSDSLLEFNNGYLIQILNSYETIFPFDSYNLRPGLEYKYKNDELTIIIGLLYYLLGNMIQTIMPCIETIVANPPAWKVHPFNNTPNMLEYARLIKTKELQLFAIYLVRTVSFLKNHRLYHRQIMHSIALDKLLNENDELSINDRYLRLKSMKYTNFITEIQVKAFSLYKGMFFQNWNYPNINNLKPFRNTKFSQLKIANTFKDDDELIHNFFTTNNGFFSFDYNCFEDLKQSGSISRNATFIDGEEMKLLWKLLTYIRINNL